MRGRPFVDRSRSRQVALDHHEEHPYGLAELWRDGDWEVSIPNNEVTSG